MMKKICLFLALLCLPVSAFAAGQEWQVFKSTHFLIFYQNANQAQLDKMAEKAEGYYNTITEDLGFNRFNFWTWDNRARIYLFDNQRDYMRSTGDPSWAAGQAQVNSKVIQTFITANGFLENVLPHEMGHIIFREMVGFNNPAVPLWLEEGVACFQEKKRSFNKAALAARVRSGNFLTLERLNGINSLSSSPDAEVSLFYTESYSLVRYLIADFGKDRFVLFCQYLRDKRDLSRALALAYSFKDLNDFENSWKKYILR
jgi:hypothetical protein